MIEYILNSVMATSGEDIPISAYLYECENKPITADCSIVFSDNKNDIATIPGFYVKELEVWSFTIPAKITTGLNGRFWYRIKHKDESISFKQPLYLK